MEAKDLDVQPIMQMYRQRLKSVDLRFKRYLYGKINWEARLIGIKGARGVGKTTLMLQRIADLKEEDISVYLSLDNMWFSIHSLEDLIAFLYPRGITKFYLDEVHKYPHWATTIKNIYDTYSDIHIVYTGSALLAIDHSIADLSRRQSLYRMRTMSFREFLEYEGIISLDPISFNEILERHNEISATLAAKFRPLQYFSDYLTYGCYPFYKENKIEFLDRLAEVVRTVIEVDIPECEEISLSTMARMKTLLMIMAENAPLTPNISKLAERLECSRELALKMLYLLDKAGLLQLMFYKTNSYKQIRGPEKVLLGDSNILQALTRNGNIGTLRETFFVNQLRDLGEVTLSKEGDFRFDGNYLFEVGGSNKKYTQIADIPNSYLAVDNTETGFGNRIPLYLFGLLY